MNRFSTFNSIKFYVQVVVGSVLFETKLAKIIGIARERSPRESPGAP